MARKDTVTVVNTDEDPSITAAAEELARLNIEEGGEVFRVTDELRGTQGVELMVIRLTGTEDQRGYCGMMPVAEFSHDHLKKIYGSGRYKIRIQGPKGFLPGGGNIKIAETPQATKVPGGNGDFMSFMESIEKRNAERSAKIWDLAMVAVPTLLSGLFNRQQSDMPALIAALKPVPGPTITDLTAALANMQSLTAPKSSESTVDTVLKVFEAAQGLVGGDKDGKSGEGSNWVDVIRDLIKVAPDAIKPMLEARMQQMQAGQPVVVTSSTPQPQVTQQSVPVAAHTSASSTVPNPTPTQPAVSAATSNGSADMMALFLPLAKVNLAKIAGWAEKERDPQVYADVLVDELPDNFGNFIPLDKILEYLNHPQWFETIVAMEPRLQTHRDWCDECRLEVIEIMKGFQSELEPTPATPKVIEQPKDDSSQHGAE